MWWFQRLFYFHPSSLFGKMIQFDYVIFSKWVETTNYSIENCPVFLAFQGLTKTTNEAPGCAVPVGRGGCHDPLVHVSWLEA